MFSSVVDAFSRFRDDDFIFWLGFFSDCDIAQALGISHMFAHLSETKLWRVSDNVETTFQKSEKLGQPVGCTVAQNLPRKRLCRHEKQPRKRQECYASTCRIGIFKPSTKISKELGFVLRRQSLQ